MKGKEFVEWIEKLKSQGLDRETAFLQLCLMDPDSNSVRTEGVQ